MFRVGWSREDIILGIFHFMVLFLRPLELTVVIKKIDQAKQ